MNRMLKLATALAALATAFGSNATAQQPTTADEAAWQDALRARSVAACQRYLDDFPTGMFAARAYTCVVSRVPPPVPPTLMQRPEVGDSGDVQTFGVEPGPY